MRFFLCISGAQGHRIFRNITSLTCNTDVVSEYQPAGGRREAAHHNCMSYLAAAAAAAADGKRSPFSHFPFCKEGARARLTSYPLEARNI